MPSARGFGKQLNSQVGSQVDTEGRKTGGRFTAAIGRGLKAGAIGVGATAAAGLGVALTKGFSRLKAIDEARAKLEGLGNSTKTVDNIMANALNSVRGTAFGLGDAASVAAGTVAAGVKPGRDLEKTLKLVADSATIAGTDLGSMGAIFNKVAASNKIQGDVIAQLSDAGIPIIQLLSQELGTSAEETVKLASAGKINFATFESAMQSGLGGAAQKSGNTFSGALANVGAALGRVGAGLLGGIFPKMAPLFQKVTTSLGPMEEVAARVGERIGEFAVKAIDVGKAIAQRVIPVVATMISTFQKVVAFVVRFREVFGAVAAGILVAVAAFKVIRVVTTLWAAAQAILNTVLLANPIGLIVIAIAALVAGFIYAWRNSETFRNIVTTAWNAIKTAALAVFGFLAPYVRASFTVIRAVAARVLPAIAATFRTVFTVARVIVTTVMRVIVGAVRAGIAIVRAVVRGVSAVVGFFKSAFDRAKSAVSAAFGRIKTAVSTGVREAVKFVKEMPGKAVAAISGGASRMATAGRELIGGLVRGIGEKIGEAVQKVQDGLGRIRGLLPGSPIKWGPLKSWNNGGAGKRLMSMLADGLGYTKPVDQAMQRLTSRMAVADLSADVRATTSGLAASAIGGGSASALCGPVTLIVGDREMQAWFEDNYDDMRELERQ